MTGPRGPVPKRSTQRRRKNKPAMPVTKAAGAPDAPISPNALRGPDLKGTHTAIARRFWNGLRESGQSAFYEPSDWAAAELVVVAIDTFVKKPTAMMLGSINSAMATLMVTEGDRRRLHLELEREKPAGEELADVSELAEWRGRLQPSG